MASCETRDDRIKGGSEIPDNSIRDNKRTNGIGADIPSTAANATATNSDLSSVQHKLQCSQSGAPMTVREYAQVFDSWLWQQHCWVQQWNCAAWMHYNVPFFAAAAAATAATPQPPATSIPPVGQPVPRVLPQHHIRQQNILIGREFHVPSLTRRLGAEFIDFLLVFSVKLLVSLIAIDLGFNLFQTTSDTEIERLLSASWDSSIALAVTTEILFVEVINRIFICIFETVCLWKIGATPGKRIMGICVVSCEELTPLTGNRIRISPSGNISFFNALVRATIKNFSVAFFFPVCFTVFFFHYNRTMYDIISGSIVVCQPEETLHVPRRHR